jgi:hypothetical protein
LGSSISPLSDQVKVTTTLETGEIPTKLPEIKFTETIDGMFLSGLTGGELVRIYSISGVLYHQQVVKESHLNIHLRTPDVYILSIQHNDYSIFRKIIR